LRVASSKENNSDRNTLQEEAENSRFLFLMFLAFYSQSAQFDLAKSLFFLGTQRGGNSLVLISIQLNLPAILHTIVKIAYTSSKIEVIRYGEQAFVLWTGAPKNGETHQPNRHFPF